MMPAIHRKTRVTGVLPAGRSGRDADSESEKNGARRRKRPGGKKSGEHRDTVPNPAPQPETGGRETTGKHLDIRV